jgi:hypothetical protein
MKQFDLALILPLTESEEARLFGKARAEGTTVEQVVREAIAPILATPDIPQTDYNKRPRSLLGIRAQYGPGPCEEEIDQNRAEMFSTFGRDDIG